MILKIIWTSPFEVADWIDDSVLDSEVVHETGKEQEILGLIEKFNSDFKFSDLVQYLSFVQKKLSLVFPRTSKPFS